MANIITLPNLTSIFLTSSTIFFFFFLVLSAAENHSFSRNSSPEILLGLAREKLTILHFFYHDIVSGRTPTAIRVAEAQSTNTSSTAFGAVMVMDDPLTEGPEPSSKPVGKARGIYASTSQNEVGLLMVMNFVFSEGIYKGSSISILGNNNVFSSVREMAVVGGSGVFKLARGYAQARTFKFDTKTLDAVVQYDVYVFHY